MANNLHISQPSSPLIALTRRLLVLIATLACCITGSIALAQTTEIEIKSNPSSALGRIDLLNSSGDTVIRLKGLQKPTALSVNSDGSFFVVDNATHEIYLIADNGSGFSIARSWKLPDNFPYVLKVFPDSSLGALIIAHASGGFWRVGADSSMYQLLPPPNGTELFSAAAALPDGRLIISRSDAKTADEAIYLFNPTDSSWRFMTIEWLPGQEPFVPNGVSVSGESVYIWRTGGSPPIEGSLSKDILKPTRVLTAGGIHSAASTFDGGLLTVSIEGKVTQLSRDGQQVGSFFFYVQPTALGFLPSRKLIALSYEHPDGNSWPEIQDQLLGSYRAEHPFEWATFRIWFGSALGFAFVWAIATICLGHSSPSAPQNASRIAPGRSVSLSRAALALTVVGSLAGLFLAWKGQTLLLSNVPRAEWLPPYMAGALLVAFSVEAWRRLSPAVDEPERFTLMMGAPIPVCSWLYMLPTAAIAGLAAYVYHMGIGRAYYGVRESAFCAGLVLVLAVVIVEAIQCRRELLRFLEKEWLLFGIPLGVGSVTFFYRLVDVPYNTHFDFTLNSFFAGQFLLGRTSGGWNWGYVPGPAFGTLPEMIGLLIGGFTPFGYRVGNSLFNITGIFAVYLLGKTYRNPRVGFWAALTLAGNIPFIHFGRLQSNGSSATIALWTLALFVLALKHKRISLWTLVGLASGFSFYQWPVARVGFTAVGCTYALIFLCYPMTQIRQSRQLLAGLATFLLMIAPLIILWQQNPGTFMPRANQSIHGVTWDGSWFHAAAEHPTLQLLYRSFAWLFNEYDRSSQGTIGPGFNSFEAVLFACGCVVLLIEGISFNVLLGVFLLITFFVCGAFAVGPPWYTRLLPTAPVACVLLGRTIEGLHNLIAGRRELFGSLFLLSGAALIGLSTVPNFQKYVAYETHTGGGRYLSHPMVAIGRRIHQIGPEPTYILLARGHRDWMLKRLDKFGLMLPYVHGLRIKEVYDVIDELEVPPGTRKAFIVQLNREQIDLPQILRAHPGSPMETIKDINGDAVALLVIVTH